MDEEDSFFCAHLADMTLVLLLQPLLDGELSAGIEAFIAAFNLEYVVFSVKDVLEDACICWIKLIFDSS